MCRFLAFKGKPILINELLYLPHNSLIRQSYKAQEYEEPLNGDGFGIGWYDQRIDSIPGVFISSSPAWHNRNLRYLAGKIKTNCLFAHIRAASSHSSIEESNCHPFHFRKYLMMHNGDIGGFLNLKRSIRRQFSDVIYNWAQGQTDSQHFFGLFLDNVLKKGEELSAEEMAISLEETIRLIKDMQKQQKVTDPSFLNIAITDGKSVVATRYVSDPEYKVLSLYYADGGHYEVKDGVCMIHKREDLHHSSVLIVSEKLTDKKEDWHEVPRNHIVVVSEDLTVVVRPIND